MATDLPTTFNASRSLTDVIGVCFTLSTYAVNALEALALVHLSAVRQGE